MCQSGVSSFFFFNDTATTEIYTLSLHDALPICLGQEQQVQAGRDGARVFHHVGDELAHEAVELLVDQIIFRSEEHTSELQSHSDLVCRLLLEKKKKNPGI